MICSVDNKTVTRASVSVPLWGRWWAGLDLQEPATLSGQVQLKLADLTLVGTVVSSGMHEGRASCRIVGGYGGWDIALSPKGYSKLSGVPLSLPLSDAAKKVGEKLGAVPSMTLGEHYAVSAEPAYRMLNGLLPQNWHVDFAGVTQCTSWPVSTYSGTAPRTLVDPGGLVVELAADSLAGIVPGAIVDGGTPATDVEYRLDSAKLTAVVWRSPSSRLDSWVRLFDAVDPRRRYRGIFEYRVVTQSGERLNLQPIRIASGMPDLAGVPVRGPAGYKATVVPGEHVLVAFADADPSRPQVIAHDAPDAPGWQPSLMQLGASAVFAALAPKVDKAFEDLVQWCTSHTHATAGLGTPSPPAPPPTPPASVAAAKTKLE